MTLSLRKQLTRLHNSDLSKLYCEHEMRLWSGQIANANEESDARLVVTTARAVGRKRRLDSGPQKNTDLPADMVPSPKKQSRNPLWRNGKSGLNLRYKRLGEERKEGRGLKGNDRW